MGDEIRAFVAVEVPEDVKIALASALSSLREELPRARWTRPEGWHLTLKFLGDAARAQLAGMIRDLGPSLDDRGGVRVHFRGSGFFPHPARPRIAWIGGAAEGLPEIAAAVDEAAASAGFARERRPWSLHLTIARLRTPWPRAAVERFLEWGEELTLPSFESSEVVLFKSDLEPSGAVYTPLERLSLH